MRFLLFIAAIVLFVLAALLVLLPSSASHDVIEALPLFGLACLAAGHVVPD